MAFEKDPARSKTLLKMVKVAGSQDCTLIHAAKDFLGVDPSDPAYRHVGALLLDPSCSGSGIVGRDAMPELHLPRSRDAEQGRKSAANTSRKRKAEALDGEGRSVLVDDDGRTTALRSESDLKARLEALSSFQLALILHAFRFPAATKITYSTCSVHAEENEHVVFQALQSDVARDRGWHLLERRSQVPGMREWPVRGDVGAAHGDEGLAEACIRANRDDSRGTMGFFVAGFLRDPNKAVPEHQDADDSEWEGFKD